MILSIVTIFFLVPGIVAMGIGLGAAYPDFKAENPTQTVACLWIIVQYLSESNKLFKP